jgi:hypothetical protein
MNRGVEIKNYFGGVVIKYNYDTDEVLDGAYGSIMVQDVYEKYLAKAKEILGIEDLDLCLRYMSEEKLIPRTKYEDGTYKELTANYIRNYNKFLCRHERYDIIVLLPKDAEVNMWSISEDFRQLKARYVILAKASGRDKFEVISKFRLTRRKGEE